MTRKVKWMLAVISAIVLAFAGAMITLLYWGVTSVSPVVVYIALATLLLATFGFLLWAYRSRNPRVAPVVTPGSPPPPTGLRWLWCNMKELYVDWWSGDDAKVIPIVIDVIMIDYLLATLYPTFVWQHVMDDMWFVVGLHAIWCLGLSQLRLTPAWKSRTVGIMMVLCVVAVTTRTLHYTPWFGEEWWKNRASHSQSSGSSAPPTAPASARTQATVGSAAKEPETIMAPTEPGRIRIRNTGGGLTFKPSGPVTYWDDKNRPYRAEKWPLGKDVTLPPSRYFEIQSRSSAGVPVIVERH